MHPKLQAEIIVLAITIRKRINQAKGEMIMAQSYVWKVTYTYRKHILSGWKTFSKVFTNKVEVMKFENQM